MRRIAFYVLTGLLVLALTIQWWVVLTPALVWLPDGFVNDFFSPRVDDFAIHRIHRLALALSHVVVLFGLASQFRRPEAQEAPMWQASGFFGAAILLNLVIGPTSEQVPPPLWIIFGLGVVAGVLHPTSPLRRVPRPTDRRLLALAAVVALPVAFYVLDQVGAQISGIEADPHWAGSHYQFAGEFGVHLILLGLVSSTAFTGKRVTAWMAGLSALLMGGASVVFPDQTSSLGIGWGTALAVWGLIFILTSEWVVSGSGALNRSRRVASPVAE
ncbi:MAG TPA: hypothetical protein VLB85_14020 [Acidimicrobiia bacterium]|nr:hypothetical protein [Acidimicrobiia bacterium]